MDIIKQIKMEKDKIEGFGMKRMSHYDNEKIIFIHLTFVQIIYSLC